jgi:quinoprotein glucose dehydrogenase
MPAPPWSFLVGVHLERGEIRWRVPLGEPGNGRRGFLSIGPALVAGGLAWIGATAENKLRAFDLETGKVVASYDLPAGVHGGPMTYRVGTRSSWWLRPVGMQDCSPSWADG